MVRSDIRRLRGTVISDIPRDSEQLRVFADAFSEAAGQSIYPASMRIQLNDIVKFRTDTVLNIGVQQRFVIPALLFRHPVLISHRYPPRPPLTRKALVFSDIDLMSHLELEEGMPVRLDVDRKHFAHAHTWDWARSISTVLDGGIDK